MVSRATGRLSTGKDQSFEQFANYYYTHAGSQQIRTTTRDDYLYILRHYAFPAIGRKQLRSITKHDLENLLYGLRKRYAATTVNQLRTLLKKLFSVALDEELIVKNPMATIPKFKKEPTDKTNKRVPPNAEEVREILRLAAGTDLELFLHLLCSTGMRRGEVLGLHWEDFNFDLGTVTVNRTLREGTRVARDGSSISRPTYNPPKTVASRRTLRLAPPVLDLLHLVQPNN